MLCEKKDEATLSQKGVGGNRAQRDHEITAAVECPLASKMYGEWPSRSKQG
jgi:hypothetical protein